MKPIQNKTPKNFLSQIFYPGAELKRMQSALEYRYQYEKLIAEISTQFISLTVDKIEVAIEETFHQIGIFAGVDRGYIFWYTDMLGRHMEKIHEWCAPSIPSVLNRVRELHMGMFPYFDQKIKNLEPFSADRVIDLPAEAESEKREFSAQGVQSLIFVPMIYGGKAIGFIGFETLGKSMPWSEDTIALLKRVSEIFVNALERVRSDKILRQSEERYALIARGVNDGLWDWNLKTNEIFFSPRWKSMLGYDDLEISDDPDEWFKRIHSEDREYAMQKLREHLEDRRSYYESEHRMLHKDGSYRWMLTRGLAVKDEKGRIWRMAGSQTDITGRVNFEEQLKHNALHDSLTGLPNRVLFMNRLKAAIDRKKDEKNYLFAVLFMDLDRFKAVNDSFGHLFGDELLIQVSQKIESCVNGKNTIARFAGDEFTILLDELRKPDEALQVAETIQKVLEQPFYIREQTIITSASMGIAYSSSQDIRCETDLLRNADTAMYRAKIVSKGQHTVYTENMHAEVLEMLKLETDLRQASEKKNFELHYQPIVSLQTGEMKGFEALIRWTHADRGLVSPATFIPIAEETGLIIPIGLWVLEQACREASLWETNTQRPLSVSVNLSAKQLLQSHLVEQVKAILKETGLEGNRLQLEITESVFVEDVEAALKVLSNLKELGIKLHLDDFGTGYSSLSSLHQFQISTLKIDRSFIQNIGEPGENSEIVKTIIAMAHNMDMEVIAEGIETEGQMNFLRSLGCEYGQGYLFAKPLPSEAAWLYMTKQ